MQETLEFLNLPSVPNSPAKEKSKIYLGQCDAPRAWDHGTPTLGLLESELLSSSERLGEVRWTIKRGADISNQGPTDSVASSVGGYEWHDPELLRDGRGIHEVHEPADGTCHCSASGAAGRETPEAPKLAVASAVSGVLGLEKHQLDPYCVPVPIESITIGVELELIITDLLPGPMHQLFDQVSQVLTPLATKLNTVVRSEPSQPHNSNRHHSFQVHSDLSIRTSPTKALLFQRTHNLPTNSPLTAKGVEIATPILHHPQWEWVLPEMTHLIHTAFHTAFNASTGLHVHVGIGRAYRLQDLRRIAKAIVLFESAMDTYHPASRSPSNPESNPHILACRDSLPLKGLSDADRIRKLDTARDTDELFQILQSAAALGVYSPTPYHRGYRYNLASVNRYGTVEFRQAVGTADGHGIVDWVGRTIRFVRSAVATRDEVLDAWGEHGVVDSSVYERFGVPSP